MLPRIRSGVARGSAPPRGGLLRKGFDRAAFRALAGSVGTRKSRIYDTPAARRTRKLAFQGKRGEGLLILGIGRVALLGGQFACRCDDPKAMPRDRKVGPVGSIFAGDLDVIPTQAFGQGTKTCRSQERPVKPSGRLDFCGHGFGLIRRRLALIVIRHQRRTAAKSIKVRRSLTHSSGTRHGASSPSSVEARMTPLPASG